MTTSVSTKVKVLIATHQTQGRRSGDFCRCNEGEMVLFPSHAPAGGDIDDPAGSHRCFMGITSRQATTTAKVVEVDLTRESLEMHVLQQLRAAHHPQALAQADADDRFGPVERWILGEVSSLLDAIEGMEPGTIVEKRSAGRGPLTLRVRA